MQTMASVKAALTRPTLDTYATAAAVAGLIVAGSAVESDCGGPSNAVFKVGVAVAVMNAIFRGGPRRVFALCCCIVLTWHWALAESSGGCQPQYTLAAGVTDWMLRLGSRTSHSAGHVEVLRRLVWSVLVWGSTAAGGVLGLVSDRWIRR
jgi:hypothetical protein